MRVLAVEILQRRVTTNPTSPPMAYLADPAERRIIALPVPYSCRGDRRKRILVSPAIFDPHLIRPTDETSPAERQRDHRAMGPVRENSRPDVLIAEAHEPSPPQHAIGAGWMKIAA